VEETKSLKSEEHELSRLDDERTTQIKNVLNANIRGHNSALQIFITKYEDRIKKLQS
jgi:hypothetical protein